MLLWSLLISAICACIAAAGRKFIVRRKLVTSIIAAISLIVFVGLSNKQIAQGYEAFVNGSFDTINGSLEGASKCDETESSSNCRQLNGIFAGISALGVSIFYYPAIYMMHLLFTAAPVWFALNFRRSE